MFQILITVSIFLTFFNANFLAKTMFFKCLANFFMFSAKIFCKGSYFYWKLIVNLFKGFKSLFFISFIPLIIQIIIAFCFLFDFFWYIYLFSSIATFIFVLPPYFFYLYLNDKIKILEITDLNIKIKLFGTFFIIFYHKL
jgi:hypothetical protein